MEWIPITALPEDENILCLWVNFYTKDRILQSDVYSLRNVRRFRKYELANRYTHYLILPLPPKE